MPQTSANVARNDTVRSGDHNTCVADLSELFNLEIPPTATPTYTGSLVTQLDWGTSRALITYNGRKVSTIVYQKVAGTTTYTWTYNYSGRKISSIVRS